MNWKEKLQEWFVPKNGFQWVVLIGLVAFCSYKVREGWQIDDEIEKYAAETPGTMIDYYRWGKGNRASVFEYEVDGCTYRAKSYTKRFQGCEDTKWCLGKRHMIRYSSIHPEKGKVLWDSPLPRLDSLQQQ